MDKITPNKHLLLAAPRGFCAGVRRAIDTAEAALRQFPAPLYCLNEIVHNRQVVEQLTRHGMIFVKQVEEVPPGSVLLFSAHGVPPRCRELANHQGIKIIDATCPFVDKVHREVRHYAAAEYSVFLIGKHGHDEVLGVAGEAPEHVMVIASQREAQTVVAPDPHRVAVVTQTTLSDLETAGIKNILTARFPAILSPHESDICYATRNRQRAVLALAARARTVFVLGSSNSSNSQRLVEVAQQAGAATTLIPDMDTLQKHIPPDLDCLGLTAGASVPELFVAETIAFLQAHGFTNIEEINVANEDLAFRLPQELDQ